MSHIYHTSSRDTAALSTLVGQKEKKMTGTEGTTCTLKNERYCPDIEVDTKR